MTSVIIPAAGLGTRMKPLSAGISKSMIPVNGKPIIGYILDHLLKDNLEREIVIVENSIGDISEFVKRTYWNCKNIRFAIQEDRKGPLHAINIGYAEIENINDGITIWLGDTICLDTFNYSQDFLAVHKVQDTHRWCLVDKECNLYDKVEGEVPTDLALIGVYNFKNGMDFDLAIDNAMNYPLIKNEHQISSLINEYLKLHKFSLVISNKWYDCGELNTFYESKASLLKLLSRSFNKLEVDTFYNTITKSSDIESKKRKIEDEKLWFSSLNPYQQQFIPRILPSEYGELKMSMESGTPLNEVLLYDNMHSDIWCSIVDKILKIHHEVFFDFTYESKISTNEMKRRSFEMYVIRNINRIDQLSEENYTKTYPLNLHNFEIVKTFILNTGYELCNDPDKHWTNVLHGDSHLGNLIYDPFSGSIKFVDPRGSFGKETISTDGDLRYDMGKLLQDFYCGYTMIVGNRYVLNDDDITINWVKDHLKIFLYLEESLSYDYDIVLLKKLSIVLLISCIPFHSDDVSRQQAFWNRGVQLIKDFFKE